MIYRRFHFFRVGIAHPVVDLKVTRRRFMGLALKDNQYHCYGAYLTWPDNVRYELIDGDAYLMAPAPDLAHQEVAGKI
jgi:hypothetical protein